MLLWQHSHIWKKTEQAWWLRAQVHGPCQWVWGTMAPRLPLLKCKVFQANRLLKEGKQRGKTTLLHHTSTSHRVKGLSSPHPGSYPGHPHSNLMLGLGSLQAFECKFTLGLLFLASKPTLGFPMVSD